MGFTQTGQLPGESGASGRVDAMNERGSHRSHLSPDMACFRALVLAFVRDYLAQWALSPSYGEIAAGLNSNKNRVKQAVRSLAQDGLLVRVPGPRGLRMPGELEAARRVLREHGLAHEAERVATNRAGPDHTLLPPPALDYTPDYPDKAEAVDES
ncbi:MAG: hypothetical protein AAF494_00810 [Pseudomonadota bacterium]